MEFQENIDHGAGELMDGILADSSSSTDPFFDTDFKSPEIEAFNDFGSAGLSVSNMKKIGLHHDEAFEL